MAGLISRCRQSGVLTTKGGRKGMWPYPIDWSATAACVSALITVAVFAWSIEQARRNTLSQHATSRLAWVEKFRADLAQFMAQTAVVHGRNIGGQKPDVTDKDVIEHFALYHRLMMSLPLDRPHFEDLRKGIYTMIEDTATPEQYPAFREKLNALEHTALAAFETERQMALREMRGEGALLIRRVMSGGRLR